MPKWLFHTYTQGPVEIQLDDHWFRMPPNEPFEVDSDSNGRKLEHPDFYAHHIISQYGGIYGIVEIESARSRNGITLDIDKAQAQATAALLLNRHRHINLWAQDQLSTRVNKNLPVMAPSGFVAESIRVLNLDLDAAYRIRPVGWDFRPTAESSANPTLLGPPVGADNGEQIASMQAQIDTLVQTVNRLLGAQVQSNPAAPPPATPKPPAHKER